MMSLSILSKGIFENIIQHPNEGKYHQIKLTSKIITSKIITSKTLKYPTGEKLMKMGGG